MDLLKLSKRMADLIESQAAAMGVSVSICVVDIHGNVVLKHRMTGAPFISVEVSERKAYTSALLSTRTAELTPLVQPGQSLFTLTSLAGGRFCALGGGIPIEVDGKTVAGVGVSGSTTEKDTSIVEVAMRWNSDHG